VSQGFCTTCNRVLLTAEGGLRTCLFSLHETPLRDLAHLLQPHCALDG
jgi:molybdenum cofactor biosynthesis enzyme MoaA